MISRRNFFAITILMFTILFLCMCINSLKDSWNDYAVNTYTETAENYPSKINIYLPTDFGKEDSAVQDEAAEDKGETIVSRDKVVCIGASDEMCMKAAAEWAKYTKRSIAAYASLASYRAEKDKNQLPEMLVIDSGSVNWQEGGEIEFLNACVEEGTHLVFCSLPEVSVVRDSVQVQELLGIRKVLDDEITVRGFYLREGFLLGGETFYLDKESPDADTYLPGSGAFPGEKTFPWYLPASGTKVYMKGIPEGDAVEASDYPIVMWRKSFGTAYVFAVNGGFMEGLEGIGILSAISAEMYSYEIYPVLNAQNMVFTGYPSLADENTGEIERIYSRPIKMVFQELAWPDIRRFFEGYHYKATCMMTPQYDYLDSNEPDGQQFKYYLKIFHEEFAETGLSGLSKSDISLAEKLRTDGEFLQNVLENYDIISFYAADMEEDRIAEALKEDVLASARTVVTDYHEMNMEPVRFLSENVTGQSTLVNGMEYTYKSDFLVRAMETALGYFSMSFDMSKVAYPEDDKSTWEHLSRTMATTVGTYGKLFPEFAGTTTAECDMRIRQFLAMDYQDSRTDDTIRLHVEGVTEPVWFIVRTHNEAIREMEGGNWKKLEDGAYLIEVTERDVTLTLEPADERYYR